MSQQKQDFTVSNIDGRKFILSEQDMHIIISALRWYGQDNSWIEEAMCSWELSFRFEDVQENQSEQPVNEAECKVKKD